MIGTTLAHYRITAALGVGGMGEVYRARDTKLDREVALKVLPEAFANDPDRLARFEREAKVLASLNHPNIAHLYGLETVNNQMAAGTAAPQGSQADAERLVGQPSRLPSGNSKLKTQNSKPTSDAGAAEVTFLVMELVEGEDLSERIRRGPVPVDEVLVIAKQVAEALEAAHEQGIVHRDLKPANIKITENGTVKVLDFGLAKAWETEGSDSSISISPTMTRNATMEGVILGTAAYMSPEQARGKKADRRFSTPRLSPDGRSIAVTIDDGNPDIWVFRLDRKVLNRLTFSPRSEHTPIWYPDGRRIAFVLDAPPFHLYAVPADGSFEPAVVLESPIDSYVEAISPDGRWMVVRQSTDGDYSLGLLELGGGPEVRPLCETRFTERFATVSPDGRYVAYESNESGRREVYIQSFPGPGVRLQVTRSGGEAPLWAGNSELFFWNGDQLFVVPIGTTPELMIGEPEALFSLRRYTTNQNQEYDVTADGRHILMVKLPEASKPREVQIVLNWFTELERLAGPGGAR